ncbi:Uncharacterised protein [Staphylococcus petrasii]|uniref:Uncharacterized protein n=1 Tax=Staphylococcus petrasii TaxID=1276936 RepID=A0A380FXN9_9STAP|nr:hypothetical protein [Staphylococcus petrasii]PNZ31812.1 hypothetical protein CD137_02445 [Staphylococcus petrasii]TGE11827.1 hypothetical protein E2557_07860 [Staphylococcus petrasii]TGE16359.1 hypothetical protein BJR09_09560 [Staphylococcus petrasii]SUM42723.1 Uncharacterised protein [Staphylococcus petrasii]
MLYDIITEQLAKYNETPSSIVSYYEQIEFGLAQGNEQHLLECYFQRIFHYLNHLDNTRHLLQQIATTPHELTEWYVLHSYVLRND